MTRYLIAGLAMALILALWRLDHVSTSLSTASKRVGELEIQEQAYEHSLAVRDSIDAQYQEALNNAETKKAQLVADVRTGVKRVYVRAACPQLPDTKSPGSSHAAAPELEPDARQDYADLREANDKVMAQVAELQNYIVKACLKKS
ncbi:prophage endopeptidase [Pseudomonas sp. LAMO17WK12:I10]|uniref:lysis system i-spanin subunit Rz n=1 Tax=unclassified Pseudomonas TaxID=196821 RepID=UPI000BC97A64|nr:MULTISPECIES: lysis system i-spanin subunit Rz [unclassified Pseudomonas]SNY45533.1 prophage endopeptidase [Pseudomonas sp. LAMO17WK12:I10]